ncbi:EamA family transporter [Pedobacter sp. BAL39]|uniref:EamA family transporter n=1 Tax=Pedobacter sp. BAL39 TaxID=391596 RepID=UPI000587FA7F|nr:EamA family transporter [Pedobacter sp. BAL39]
MAKSNVRYFLAGFLSFAIWGMFSIPLRNLKAYPSQEILYYRIFVSLVCIWLAILLFRRKELRCDVDFLASSTASERIRIGLQILVSTLLLTGNWYTYIYAVNHVSLQSGAFAYMVCPLITAFGGFILLNEQLSRLKLISLGIALLSVILLGTGSLIEVLWSVVIATLYALYLIMQRKMQHLDKLNLLAFQIVLAAILILPFYLSKHNAVPIEPWFWGNIIIVAVVFTIVPLFLSLYALIGIPSSSLGIIIYINPIIAFAVAILYFGEHLDSGKMIAYAFLAVSVIVFNWGMLKDILTFKRKIS